MRSNSIGSSATAQLSAPLSNPDKMFWPKEGYTKRNLAEYYDEIFPKLSPYVNDRMLALERCPDGMLGKCFFQKQTPRSMPIGTPTRRLEHVGHTGQFTDYVVGGSRATQLALVNLGCIAVHVLIPIQTGPDADQVLAFTKSLVARVACAHPRELTVEHSIAARRGRVYLDPFRNAYGQTVVAPYSVRRREKAPISTPLRWSEVIPTLVPSDFNLGNFTAWSGMRPASDCRSGIRWRRSNTRPLPPAKTPGESRRHERSRPILPQLMSTCRCAA